MVFLHHSTILTYCLGCVKIWVKGIHLLVEDRGSICSMRECTKQDLCLPSGEGKLCTIACTEPENSTLCLCIYIYVFMGNARLNTFSLLGCMRSLYNNITFSIFEIH